jgi:CheY-like chemotaxis protein
MKPDKPNLDTRHLGKPTGDLTPIPPRVTTSPLQHGLPWVIEFRIVGTATTIPVQVHEHMIIGRADPEHGLYPAIDLGPHGGLAQGVSRQHAVIVAKDNRILIKDLASVNGTRLNGYVLPPNQEYRLRNDDMLTIGKMRLQVRFAFVPTFNTAPLDGDSSKIELPVVGNGEHILVVEDDTNVGSAFSELLEHAGFKVTWMDTAVTALGAISHKLPDAMVLDLLLPDMDGLDLARYVRKQPTGKGVPIIVVSGATGGFQMNKALEAGCDAFLGKPVSVDELLRAISTRLTPDEEEPVITS